jgi:hypothetical protein
MARNGPYLNFSSLLGDVGDSGGYGGDVFYAPGMQSQNFYQQSLLAQMMGAPYPSGLQQAQLTATEMQLQAQMMQNQAQMMQQQLAAMGQQNFNPYAQQYEELFRDNSVAKQTNKPKPVQAVRPKDTVRRLDLDGDGEVAVPAVVARQIDF